jgi:hypothetical protein
MAEDNVMRKVRGAVLFLIIGLRPSDFVTQNMSFITDRIVQDVIEVATDAGLLRHGCCALVGDKRNTLYVLEFKVKNNNNAQG